MVVIPQPIGAVRFRLYRDDSDLAGLVQVYNGARRADGITVVVTLEGFTSNYQHLRNCDLHRDLLIAETDSGIVGYSRVEWSVEEANGNRMLLHVSWLLPEARGIGVAERILAWSEARLTEIAHEQTHEGKQFFVAYVDAGEAEREHALVEAGYSVVQTFAEMVRPLSDPIPDIPLPDGVEIRPVTWADGRAIWEADDRAFHDHVGYTEQNEVDYDGWVKDEHADPSLWKVAFAGDAIAGQVLNYVNALENTEFKRKRGWTESISVQREWRKRGLAKALIVESMRMFKQMGMDHVALGVHTTNPNGAFPLYEALGYKVTLSSWELRKPFA